MTVSARARFLVGGYGPASGGTAPGIGLAERADDGRLRYRGVLARLESPSWLLVDEPVGAVLAVDESAGVVHSFRPGPRPASGAGSRPSDPLVETGRTETGQSALCHLAVDGDHLVASSYGSGTVTWLRYAGGVVGPVARMRRHEGSGPHPDQSQPRAHAALALGDGRVLVLDLGTDRVEVYADHGATRLGAVELPAGTGPRDLARLPDGRILVLGELAGTLIVLDPTPSVPRILGAAQMDGAGPRVHFAAIALLADPANPGGWIAAVGVRRADLIATVAIPPIGAPEFRDVIPSAVRWSRSLAADGDLVHVAGQHSNDLATYRLETNGGLRLLGGPTPAPSPAHLVPLPAELGERLATLVG